MSANGSGVVPSPNIWNHPATYELENRAVDPDGVVDAAIRARHDWQGQVVLDVGCGSGYFLPRFAADARRVIGVEPHAPLVRSALQRARGLDPATAQRIEVRPGTAQRLPLPDASVDVAHARWAYFFGPGCEPGLAELARVVRRGGTAFVVDVDATRSTYGRWFRQSLPRYDPVAVQRFWARQGWHREPLDLRWVFTDRADLEAVVRIELTPEAADGLLADVPGLEIDYAANLFWRRY
ncbi:MAG TPA: class I SAM-dependent methyltransferase [Angustibacter sp.]|nr:class I SAM-dependent methyltransferase [Angustibacter sp.]